MKIVTDSAADIPRQLVEELGITVVPLTVHFGDKSYLDYVELNPSNFYDLLRSSPEHPRTSQPSPGDFKDVFEKLTADGSPVVAVLLSGELSGTYQSATLAREMLPDRKIEVIDSRLASMCYGLAAVDAARAARDGRSFEEVAALGRKIVESIGVVFAVDTLEYLARNGRIGKATAFLGTMLSIKPLLTLQDGIVTPLEKVRGEKKVIPRMVEIMGERLDPEKPAARAAIVHADCLDRAEALRAAAEAAYHPAEIIVGGLGGIIGTHVGPGTIALMWYQP